MFANVVAMRRGHLGWDFQVPNQYGLHSVRSHAGILLLRITATAENADPPYRGIYQGRQVRLSDAFSHALNVTASSRVGQTLMPVGERDSLPAEGSNGP
jgi:hypothetical protein